MKRSSLFLIIGGIFISLVGAILHFAFEWSNWLPIAIIAPVNESPWEHLKLTFWPAMFILIFEYFYVYKKDAPNNFTISRTIGIIVMPIVILTIYYSYTSILQVESFLPFDIMSFFIAVVVGQLVSYALYRTKQIKENVDKYSSLTLLVIAAIFIIFTFFPPQIPLFYDSYTGGYGIIYLL